MSEQVEERNYLLEATKIALGKSKMLAEEAHVKELFKVWQEAILRLSELEIAVLAETSESSPIINQFRLIIKKIL